MLQWMNMKTKKRATRTRRTGTRRRRKNRKKRRKNKGGEEEKENKNEKDQQKPTKMKGDPVIVIVISKFLEHNCRGRPKLIYAHSAVTATRPKLRFQLRPFLNYI